MRAYRHIRMTCLGSASWLALSGVAWAQPEALPDGNPEIVVTAQKREQQLQDVPAAVSALSEARLEELGGTQLRDVADTIPGLELQSDRAGETRTSIRGISEIGGGAVSVGVYIDEIPVSTFTAEGVNLQTFDVDRLEILRGPQGTLYGEGSLGGTIRIITNKPDSTAFAANLEATGLTIDHGGSGLQASGMVNVPLVEGLAALRGVALWRDMPGWIDNVPTGRTNVNDEQSFTGRISLRVTPASGLILDASYIRQDVDSGGPSSGDDQFRNFAGTPEPRSDSFDLLNLTAAYDLGGATLTSATGYFDRSSLSSNDFTAVAPLLSLIFGAPISTARITRPNDQRVFSQEVRIVSDAAGRLDWTIGAFYKHDELVIANSTVTSPALPVSVFELRVDETATQWAVFGEVDFALTPRLHAVAGLRYFSEDRDIRSTISGLLPLLLSGASANDLPVNSSEDVLTAKFSAYYEASDDVLVYGTASSGFRAGGINPNAFLFPGAPTSFGPETLWNYELGARTSWFGNRLIVNLAVFDIEWDDVIVNAISGDPLFSFSVNGGKAHSRGAELELLATPTRGLQIDATATFTDAEIDETRPIGTTPLAATAGARLPFVPRHRLHAGAQYRFPIAAGLDMRFRVDASHVGRTYSGIDNAATGINEPYGKLDLRVSLLGRSWEATAFVDNLTDARGELAATGPGTSLTIPPRTFGLTLRKRF